MHFRAMDAAWCGRGWAAERESGRRFLLSKSRGRERSRRHGLCRAAGENSNAELARGREGALGWKGARP